MISQPSATTAAGALEPDPAAVTIGDIARWLPYLSTVSNDFHIPRQILRAIVIAESAGDPWATSDEIVGFGLMQVTKEIEAQSSLEGLGDVFDPESNLRLGAEVLAAAYARWGSWDMAIMHWHDVRRPEGAMFTGGYSWGSASYQYLQLIRAIAGESGFEWDKGGFRSAAMLHALTAVGMPYVYGGHSFEHGGFDCSGLVMWAYQYAGKQMPAGTSAQWDAMQRIAEHEARPGDLVFFANTWSWGISHVGIYMGDGMMLHAPTEGKVVEIIPIHGPYWGAHLAGFGRVP